MSKPPGVIGAAFHGIRPAGKRPACRTWLAWALATTLLASPAFGEEVLVEVLLSSDSSIYEEGLAGFQSVVHGQTRVRYLEVLQAEYIKTARAKGLHPLWITYRHALRNALIPVTVMIFLSLPWLIGGAVVVETIFAWPGMGRLMVQALTQKDFPVVQGVLLMIALSTIVANLLGDIVTALLDPRIQSS